MSERGPYRSDAPGEHEAPLDAGELCFAGPQTLCGCERSRSFTLENPETRPQVAHPEAAAELLVPLLSGLDREHCVMLALDTKHRLIAATRVSMGSADHTFIAPREVYRDALAHGASAIVLGHNHPSGDPEPSQDDRRVTARLASAGETLGVEILDHLVIGSHDWVSLARRGAL